MSGQNPEPTAGPSSEFSILDIPGIECEVVDDVDGEDADLPLPTGSGDGDGGQPVASTSGVARRRVSAVPSDAGWTFLLDSSYDSDHPMNVISSTTGRKRVRFEDEEESEAEATETDREDDESVRFQRRKELADKYIAGQLNFSDFVREINPGGDESEDDDEGDADDDDLVVTQGGETADEEWRPKASSKKKRQRGEDDARHQEQFETEMEEAQRQQLSKKRRGRGRGAGGGPGSRRKRLDPHLQGLMGQANLSFVRGDRESAIRMCFEVIRQDPSVPEPFQTLSTMYEESGEAEKSLEFAILAAHLSSPQDGEEWARLADVSLEMEKLERATDCYKHAIAADVENVNYHLSRCNLLERIGDAKAALRGFRRMLGVLKPDQAAEYLHAAKEIARLLHEREDVEGAKTALKDAVDKFPEAVDSADVNLLLELLISLGQFEEALEVLCQRSGVKFSSSKPLSANLNRSEKDLPSAEQQLAAFDRVVFTLSAEGEAAAAAATEQQQQPPPVEIKTKLVVVLVNLKAAHLVKDLCAELLSLDAEEFGDLLLEVGEAFMVTSDGHADALPFLEKLVESENYAQAEVWLKLGECLMTCGRAEEAESSYQKVVSLAPNHLDARRTLSAILHRLGRPEEALHTLTQDEEEEILDPTLLYERCQLLLSEGREDEFLNKAKLLFSRHFVNIRNQEELHAIASTKRLSGKNKALLEVRNYRREPAADSAAASFEQASEIPVMDEFRLFRRLCDVLHSRRRFGELQRLTFSALGSPYFNKKPELVKELEFLCLLSSFLNGDSYHAYNLVRELVVRDLDNSRAWNLFNLVISRADDARHNRFLMRLMTRNQDNAALGILNGHNCLVAGTYKYSLGEYMTVFKQDPSDPLVALMLGLTFVHMACQKFSAKKHSLVVQACAFLSQYLSLRGRCQESLYNLGRAMHQLGLLPAAAHYYKASLAADPAVKDEASPDGIYDLRREAAFNLSLIYQGSGSHDLARMYVQKYIVV